MKRLFGRGAAPMPGPDESPAAGEIYGFRTSPLSDFAAPETGRFAALKILGTNDELVVFALLDGIWSARPTPQEVGGSAILTMHRFGYNGQPAVVGVYRPAWNLSVLRDAALIAHSVPSRRERAHADSYFRGGSGGFYSTIHFANRSAEGEWRWQHDRAALVAENDLVEARDVAERGAREERVRTRLGKLTWEQLLSETPFANWSPSPPFPPPEFTGAARATVHAACRELRDLGPKPRRGDVRAILRRTVTWFNEADQKAGGVIETEEREDIFAVLEDMAHVARQAMLVEEIDEWRDW